MTITRRDLYADDNTVKARPSGEVLATFSGHWPACAALIRLADPSFVSMGGDTAANLAAEEALRVRLGR